MGEPLAVHGIGTRRRARRHGWTRRSRTPGCGPPARFRDRYPHELSGGQRQRVAIACAMALGPDVLVADEPVSMLDVSLRSGILRVMLDLRERRGIGILFITHDLSLAWLIADRIAVMYLGRVVEIGPAEQLVRDPRHPYTRALLSVMPSPDPAHRRQRQILRGETPDAVPHPARLPLPHPLPRRVRPVPDRGPARGRGRARPCRGLLPRGDRQPTRDPAGRRRPDGTARDATSAEATRYVTTGPCADASDASATVGVGHRSATATDQHGGTERCAIASRLVLAAILALLPASCWRPAHPPTPRPLGVALAGPERPGPRRHRLVARVVHRRGWRPRRPECSRPPSGSMTVSCPVTPAATGSQVPYTSDGDALTIGGLAVTQMHCDATSGQEPAILAGLGDVVAYRTARRRPGAARRAGQQPARLSHARGTDLGADVQR